MSGGYPFKSAIVKPEQWNPIAQVFDALEWGNVELQIIGTIQTAYVVERSLDGQNFTACPLYTSTGVMVEKATAPGTYSVDGYSYIRIASGAGAQVWRRAAAISSNRGGSSTGNGVSAGTLQALTGTFTLPEDAPTGAAAGTLVGVMTGSSLILSDSAGGRVALSGSTIVRGSTALDFEAATSHSFTVVETMNNAIGSPRTTTLTLNVTNVFEAPNLATLSITPVSGVQNVTQTLTVQGRISGSTLTVTGSLPAGMSLNSAAGTITGTPTTAGTYNFTLVETHGDSANSPRSTQVSFITTPAPLKVLFIGSSTPDKYFTEYGVTTSSDVTKTTNGTTFTPVGSVGAGAGTFGNALNAALSRQIQLFDLALGGSTVQQWEVANSSLRSAAVAAVNAAGGVDYVILSVGRNDAHADIATSVDDHRTRLRSLISKLRSEMGLPNLKIIIGFSQNSYSTGSSDHDAAYNYVHQAEMDVAFNDVNVYYGAQAWDLTQEADGIHLDRPGYLIHATRLADQIIHLERSEAVETGMTISGVTGLTYTTTQVTFTHSLGTDFTPAAGATGFGVWIGNSQISSGSVERTSANTVVINHANNNGSPVGITFQYGASPNKSSPMRDNTNHGGVGLPVNHLPYPIVAASAGTPTSGTIQKVALIDMTRQDQTSPGGYNRWNIPNSTGNLPAGQIITASLSGSDGVPLGWTFANTADISGLSLTGYSTGTNTLFATAARVCHCNVQYPMVAAFKFTGLDPAKTYEITVYGSRSGTDTRQTDYTATGAGSPVTAVIANVINNINTNAVMTGVAPTAQGEIALTFTAHDTTSQYGYLNCLQIKEL